MFLQGQEEKRQDTTNSKEAGAGEKGTLVPSLVRVMRKDGKQQNWVVDTWTRQNQKRSWTGKTPRTFEQEIAWAKMATDTAADVNMHDLGVCSLPNV